MSETIIYQNGAVRVTTSKVAFGGTTYFLRNIASVRVVKTRNSAAVVLLLVGIMLALMSFGSLKEMWGLLLVSVAMVAGAIKWGFAHYHIHFDTSSGSVNAYRGPESEMHSIKMQIEQAMSQTVMA